MKETHIKFEYIEFCQNSFDQFDWKNKINEGLGGHMQKKGREEPSCLYHFLPKS